MGLAQFSIGMERREDVPVCRKERYFTVCRKDVK
jgi:hypothetical protein